MELSSAAAAYAGWVGSKSAVVLPAIAAAAAFPIKLRRESVTAVVVATEGDDGTWAEKPDTADISAARRSSSEGAKEVLMAAG